MACTNRKDKNMPKSNAADRLANYAAGINPERIREDFEKRKERMVTKQGEAIAALLQIEQMASEILMGEDTVTTLQYLWYLDFARQIYGLKRRFLAGKPMENEAKNTALHWKARGCDLRVLNRILAEVFSLPAAVEKK
jgi:hypothetical protein